MLPPIGLMHSPSPLGVLTDLSFRPCPTAHAAAAAAAPCPHVMPYVGWTTDLARLPKAPVPCRPVECLQQDSSIHPGTTSSCVAQRTGSSAPFVGPYYSLVTPCYLFPGTRSTTATASPVLCSHHTRHTTSNPAVLAPATVLICHAMRD